MGRKYTTEARTQALEMLKVLERLHPHAAQRLRQDPLRELRTWADLTVDLVEEEPGPDRCSVAGSYTPSPPTLVVSRAMSHRRNGFTALHELGHHLQRTDGDLCDLLFTVSNSEALEEEACDEFAAQVLLPDADLIQTIDPRGPCAPEIVDLFTSSSASREACCVWAARHLKGAGAVVLLDASGTVLFAAPRSYIPPARKSDQSRTPLIEAALASRIGQVTRDDTHIRYRNGKSSDSLYGQAAWFDGDYLVAVLLTDNVPWHTFAPPRPDYGDRQKRWTCETCDDTFAITEYCSRCREPYCPERHCGCTALRAAKDRRCSKCYMVLSLSRFDGDSTTCRDCD